MLASGLEWSGQRNASDPTFGPHPPLTNPPATGGGWWSFYTHPPTTSDVNKTKFLRPRPEQQDQDQDQSLQDQDQDQDQSDKIKTRVTRPRPRPSFRTTAFRTIHVLLIIKTVSFQCI